MSGRRGITLLETLLALVTLTIGFTALLRVWISIADGVGIGRRWTLMTAAAENQLARLEEAYRVGAPICGLPPSGAGYTPDGVGLAWTTADSAGQLAVLLEVRAAHAGRTLVDTLVSLVPCR
jgi:hypothetical protein